MRSSWKLGQVAGIDLFVHPTLLLILLFLVPAILAGNISVLTIVALFGCVVLHELGHALMARRFGIETLDITLYPIGGVARLRRMPRAPGAELLIALAGPAVNFAIVAGLLVIGEIGLFGPPMYLLGGFIDDIIRLNLVLGLFNLIPAFPMDGGRVLRALLSGWLDRSRATSIAASVGRTLAVMFGTYSLLFSDFDYGVRLLHVALAAFIYLVAGSEEAGVLAEERRRTFDLSGGQGIWTAPPGYQWVQQGHGVWRLAPIVVTTTRSSRSSSPWGD
jgi:Zn-dependent protease